MLEGGAEMPKNPWILFAGLAVTLLPAAALAAEPMTLKAIMTELRQNFLDVSDGFLLDDFDKIAEGAIAIAEHPRIPAPQAKLVADELGAEKPVFKNFDVEVHELSLEIYKAAKEGDRVAARAAYLGMISACIDCHTAYRERVGAALSEER
jgi:hypothetical protein